ncbi:MAG: XdhC family protein, partial [Pseudomonadota bacterium]
MADLRALLRFCLDALSSDEPIALVTQCAAEGSTPRELGVRMAVTPNAIVGTIGGGNLEQIALDQARKLLSSDERTCLLQDLPLGPLLAQCCGGHVRLLIESLDPKDEAWLGSCLEAIDANRSVTLRTFLDDVSPRKTVIEDVRKGKEFVFLDKTGTDLLSSRPHLADCAQMIETLSQERPQLRLYGAGHVGRAAAEVMRHTAFDVTCYDDRESERMLLPAGVAITGLPDADSVIESAPPQCHHVVLTHSHDLDYALVRA